MEKIPSMYFDITEERMKMLLNMTLEEYTNTTVTKNKLESLQYIKNYIEENTLTENVKNFLSNIIDNILTMPEIIIVYDGSWRTFCYLIQPNRIMRTGQEWQIKNNLGIEIPEDFKQYIKLIKENDAILYLNMHDDIWYLEE